MAWFSDLAGKAENLLNNLDEKTAFVLQKNQKTDVMYAETQPWLPRQTRRPFAKVQRKPATDTRSSYSPSRKTAPIRAAVKFLDSPKETPKSAGRKTPKKSNNFGPPRYPPHTMVADERLRIIDDDETVMHDYGPGFRRKSLPNSKDIEEMASRSNKLEMLRVDNEILKNEVLVCNQETSDLLDKLRDLEEDLKETEAKYENLEKVYSDVKGERESLLSELESLKKSNRESSPNPEYPDMASAYRALEQDFNDVTERNRQLQEQLRSLEMSKMSNSSIQMKLENDLRFAHLTVNDVQAELEKSRNECHRLQEDWDAYKLRVKSMLISKDKEIQALQKSPDYSEGTKMLVEQVEALREDRSQLSCAVARAQGECAEASRRIEQADARAHAAERLVAALREALREERLARNKAEGQCVLDNKELKSLQMETSHQIATLQTALRDKDTEIHHLKNRRSATSVSPELDASALNVAERERPYDTFSSERVQLLTQSLVARQGKIDALVAENGTLRLQMEKMETKHKQELSNIRSNQRIIQVTDGDAMLKAKIGGHGYVANSMLSKVCLQIGVYMRRHPMFRVFIITYMACLHVWVLVVLLTYTPEVH